MCDVRWGCSAHHVFGSSSFLVPGSNLIDSAPNHPRETRTRAVGYIISKIPSSDSLKYHTIIVVVCAHKY